jgi:kumamolisin
MGKRHCKELRFTQHDHGKDHRRLRPTDLEKVVEVTIIVRRHAKARRDKTIDRMLDPSPILRAPMSREEFERRRGADRTELEAVAAFAQDAGLDVLERNLSRRTVVARGTVKAINKCFSIQLSDFIAPSGIYFSHKGAASVPAAIAGCIEAVIGLDNVHVRATHHSTAKHRGVRDPVDTAPLTPRRVAELYSFPAGDGEGQVIGLFEMDTQDGRAGYAKHDLEETMAAFADGSKVPRLVDIEVGARNTGVSDTETGLDITVAGAVAPAATIAVYFAGAHLSGIVRTLQRMIHPDPGDAPPTIVSISYGWGPDEDWKAARKSNARVFEQIQQLFRDAAQLGITVLASAGDTGAMVDDPRQAQVSYPATDPWVLSCGGTTIGNIRRKAFDEFVWNDFDDKGRQFATGGGVSMAFAVPPYQAASNLPLRVRTGEAGRGIPDVAGNASVNSGYTQVINGQSGPVGGTSAVGPLYAGLLARINANLGVSAGYLNPFLYSRPKAVFRDIDAQGGPTNNNYGRVIGYSAATGWDACTGFGSLDGKSLQKAVKAAWRP